MSNIVIELTSGNQGNSLDIDLYGAYIKVGITNIVRTYDREGGSGTVEDNEAGSYDLVRCPESFYETDFEK